LILFDKLSLKGALAPFYCHKAQNSKTTNFWWRKSALILVEKSGFSRLNSSSCEM